MTRVGVEPANQLLPVWACFLLLVLCLVFCGLVLLVTGYFDKKYDLEHGPARTRFLFSAFLLSLVLIVCFVGATEKKTNEADWSALEKLVTKDGVTNVSLLLDLKELDPGEYLVSETAHIMVGRESETMYVVTNLPRDEQR